MKLSLCIVTLNSATYIEKLLQAGRSFADEIVVAVDSSSSDSTEEICRKYADKLFRVETGGFFSNVLPWLEKQCSGDWILYLDQDELPSAQLVKALPGLLSDREVTHYYFRRRWVIGDTQTRWIAQHSWSPDWQQRLIRNIRSLVRYPGRLHENYEVQGAFRHVYEGSIYHFDLVYHSEQQRRQKVELYERLSPGNSQGHYYLPDEASLSTAPIPEDDRPFYAHPRSGRHKGWRSLFKKHLRRRQHAVRTPTREVSLTEIRSSSVRQECEYGPELFRACLNPIDCPRVMAAGQLCWVDLDLRNESAVAWPFRGLGVPEVRVSYHWLRSTGEMYEFEGERTDLPHTLRPGETTRLLAAVRPPEDPGSYVLQWDLVVEGISWFSWKGWQGPRVEVQVVDASYGPTSDKPESTSSNVD